MLWLGLTSRDMEPGAASAAGAAGAAECCSEQLSLFTSDVPGAGHLVPSWSGHCDWLHVSARAGRDRTLNHTEHALGGNNHHLFKYCTRPLWNRAGTPWNC